MTRYDDLDAGLLLRRASRDLHLSKPLSDLSLALFERFSPRILHADNLFPAFDTLACILLAFKLAYALNDAGNSSQHPDLLPLEAQLELSQASLVDIAPPVWRLHKDLP